MKIIHLISGGDVGGAKTHVLSLLSGLKQRHQVLLVCFLEGPFAQEAREMEIPVQVLPGRNLCRISKQLENMIRAGQFELIHCHGTKANLMGAMLQRHLSLPVITTIHSDPRLDYLGRPLSNLTYGSINRWALRRLDDWVCVSEQLQNMMIESGMDPQRTFLIRNGVDFSKISASVPRAQYWSDLGLQVEKNAVVFGIAARISPVKDMGTLIRAFAQVVEQEPQTRLVIAGDGAQRQELEELAGKLCPQGTVLFAGWISDTDSFYNAIDVNMLTSLSEGLPYAIPEGARMSCATIATAVGAVPRIVVDGQTGFLVEPGDVNALAERMLQVARDGELRMRLGQAIFEKTKREFSIEATVRTQVEIYETITRRAQRRTRERDGVLICGAYGNGNVGDETILKSILQQLQSRDQDLPICVMSKSPRRTAMQMHVHSLYTFHHFHSRRQMRRTKLYISGGGSLIQDATSTRSLLFYLSSIWSAHKLGCKVMMYGCGIGPVHGSLNRKLAGRVIDACVDLIALRDPDSLKELRRLGVTKPEIHVTADPALLQEVSQVRTPAYLQYRQEAGLQEGKRYCLFALRPWGSMHKRLKVFVKAAEYGWSRYGMIPAFFLLEPEKDWEITQAVSELVQCPKLILPPTEDGSVVCALMHDMNMVVSMRLHALIFASGQGIPVVGVSYDPKVSSFMRYLGQAYCVDSETVTAEGLCGRMDAAAQADMEKLGMVHRLRELAGRNGELAWRLLRGDPAEHA